MIGVPATGARTERGQGTTITDSPLE